MSSVKATNHRHKIDIPEDVKRSVSYSVRVRRIVVLNNTEKTLGNDPADPK